MRITNTNSAKKQQTSRGTSAHILRVIISGEIDVFCAKINPFQSSPSEHDLSAFANFTTWEVNFILIPDVQNPE